MNKNSKYSLRQFLQFFLFGLFLEEMILWSPSSEVADTIILKLLSKLTTTVQGTDDLGLARSIYPFVLAGLFSASFPEIFRIIASSLKTSLLKREIVERYIKIRNSLPLLWPLIGSALVVVALVFIYNSLSDSENIVEYLIKLRQNKPLQILLYILVPITIILIWLNNLFVSAYHSNPNELIIIVGKTPGSKNYVISGPMAFLEKDRKLGDKERDYYWIAIQQFPEPLTVPLKLGNVETNFSLSIMLGAVVNEEIKNDEDAWWLFNAFRDLKNKTNTPDIRDSILITYITDEIEQAIVQAKLNLASEIQAMTGYSSDIQVNSIIMDKYGEYIDHLQKIVNDRLDMLLDSQVRILRIEFLSKKMIVNNADDRIQEDFEDFRERSKGRIGTSNSERPKVFNLTEEQRSKLLNSVENKVFKKSQRRLEQRLLNLPKPKVSDD